MKKEDMLQMTTKLITLYFFILLHYHQDSNIQFASILSYFSVFISLLLLNQWLPFVFT